MARLTDLAVETRFQVFEALLQFPRPLKRVRHKKFPTASDRLFRQPSSRTKRLFNRVNATAVVFVSRKIHHEALTVFYKLNTIRIHHHDICGWNLGNDPILCDRDLLERAILDDTSIWTPFSECGACGDDLYGVVETLNGDSFPQLKEITINVQGSNCVDELRRQLEGARDQDEEEDERDTPLNDYLSEVKWDLDEDSLGLPELSEISDEEAWAHHCALYKKRNTEVLEAAKLHWHRAQQAKEIERDLQDFLDKDEMPEMVVMPVNFGRFQILNLVAEGPTPKITFQYHDLVRIWDHYERLLFDHKDLLHHAPKPAALSDVPRYAWSLIQHFFSARAGGLKHIEHCEFAHEHQHEMGVMFGKWFVGLHEVEEGHPAMWECLTETALSRKHGVPVQYYFR